MAKQIKRLAPVFFAIMFLLSAMFYTPTQAATNEVNIYLFGQDTCTHCQAEKEFLEGYLEANESVNLVYYDVLLSEEALDLFTQVGQAMDISTNSTPVTIIGQQVLYGYYEGSTDVEISDIVSYYQENPLNYRDIVGELLGTSVVNPDIEDGYSNKTFVLPFIGEIDAQKVSLPLVAIVLGTLDGFNPCAMWALLFLMSMLFNMEDKRKIWILGITFLLTSAVTYAMFMVAWLNLTSYLYSYKFIQIGIAVVALIGGLINLRQFLKERKEEDGCEVIDEKQRKKMFHRVLKITSQQKFILAILGTMVLAFSVNLFELLCSAGLPMVFTQILSINDVSWQMNAFYIFLYMVFYLIDDLIVFAIGMATMKMTGFSTKYSKWSKLIGGIVMILIGLIMFFKPGWLRLNFSFFLPWL